LSYLRIINVPTRGLGDKGIEQVQLFAREQGCSLMEASRRLVKGGVAKIGPKLKYFVDLMMALKDDLLNNPMTDAVHTLLEALEYTDYLKKKYPDQYLDKMDNIQELAAGLAEYQKKNPEAKLNDWLQSVALVREDPDDEGPKGVSMMTLHMAKGLEFRRVYLSGVEDGLLPHRNSTDDQSSLEEERRLLYVGITRAKEKLSMTLARRRRSYNVEMVNPPSRFLKEIPQEFLELSLKAKELFDPAPVKSFSASASLYHYDEEEDFDFDEGSRVFHPTYGPGTIEGFEDNFGQRKAIVKFRDFGYRKIRPSQLQLTRGS
jgi:DNA helicase-2/ATP-dependent DNA helicase PcrA